MPTVDLNADSSASEVKLWLKSKGFSERFVVVPNPFRYWFDRRGGMLRIHCTESTGMRVSRRRSRVVYGAGCEI